MENKFKVQNLTKSAVTVNLTALNGRTKPIAPNGFTYLNEDELAYLRNTSRCFERGTLAISEATPAPLELEIPLSHNALTNDDIQALIKKPSKALATALEDIDSIQLVREIREVAIEAEKSIKHVEVIDARIESLLANE